MAGPPQPSPTRPSPSREVGRSGGGGRGSSVCLTPTYTRGPRPAPGEPRGGVSSKHVGRQRLSGPFLGVGGRVSKSLSVSHSPGLSGRSPRAPVLPSWAASWPRWRADIGGISTCPSGTRRTVRGGSHAWKPRESQPGRCAGTPAPGRHCSAHLGTCTWNRGNGGCAAEGSSGPHLVETP